MFNACTVEEPTTLSVLLSNATPPMFNACTVEEPVTASVLPSVAASSALNVPAVVMLVLIVVAALTSMAPSVTPPKTDRTESTV